MNATTMSCQCDICRTEVRVYNDFKPETRSLLERLQKAGFTLVGCNDGQDLFKFDGDVEKLVRHLNAVDDSYLYISKGGQRFTLWLVFGNSPGELVSGYSCPKSVDTDLLDEVTQAHYEAWIDEKQPTCTSL